jgi:hypothetical protein
MSCPYVIRYGSPHAGYQIVGPFETRRAADASIFATVPGAEVVPLLPMDSPPPVAAQLEDRRPSCCVCGCQEIETVEWTTWRADGSTETGIDSPIDDTYCPQCEENDTGATFDQAEGAKLRRRWARRRKTDAVTVTE